MPVPQRAKRRVKARFVIFLCIVVFIIAAVLSYALGWISFSSELLSEDASLAFSADALYTYTGSGILFLENAQLSYKNFQDASKNWVIGSVDAADVRLAASPSVCAVFNRGVMQCIDTATGAKTFNREFVGELLGVRCGNTYIAALKRDVDASLMLYILDLAGVEKDSIALGDQYVMDFGFYGSTDMLWTLSLNTKGVVPSSVLTTYGAGSKALTGIITLDSQVVEKPLLTDSNVFLVSTQYIHAYNAQNKEAFQPKLIYGWVLLDSSFTSSKPMMLFTPRRAYDTNILQQVQLMLLPDETSLFSPPRGTLNVFFSQARLLCFTPSELMIYSLKGELKAFHAFASPIEGVVKLDDTRFLLRRDNRFVLAVIK